MTNTRNNNAVRTRTGRGNSKRNATQQKTIKKNSRSNNIRSGNISGNRAATTIKHGLNAYSSVHIPLPTTVGAYHTMRAKQSFATTDYLTILGPTRFANGDWRQTCAMGYPTSVTTLNSTTAINYTASTAPSGADDVECAPAAFSVQVSSNASLLNASGVSYIGRLNAEWAPDATDGRTAQELASALISYAPLKTCTNSDLVRSQKQVNAIPHDVVELSSFAPFFPEASGTTGVSHVDAGFTAFGPIVIINPTGQSLQIGVCTEWRVRVDPFSPFHSSGTLHKPSHPSVWHAITQAATSAGHGVEDVGIIGVGAAAADYAVGGGFMASLESMAMTALEFAPLLL
jgi:hypothetical protein